MFQRKLVFPSYGESRESPLAAPSILRDSYQLKSGIIGGCQNSYRTCVRLFQCDVKHGRLSSPPKKEGKKVCWKIDKKTGVSARGTGKL